jgi:uncharacterized protein YbjT (DUF2867 family)
MKIAVAGASGRAGRHVVDLLAAGGHDAVAISRTHGVDVISGEGLAEALTGVEVVIDVATGPSPDEQPATEFFVTATRNLHEAGARAGVQRIVVASIIGTDRFSGGYGAAKLAHERAMQAGPIPVRILRASQFHEFVEQLVQWGTQGDVAYVQRMRTQPIAARAFAQGLIDLALAPDGAPLSEIAGPREENLAEMARLLVARRGTALRIEEQSDPNDPVFENGGLLPGPDATLAGPTFTEWLDATG